MSLLLKLSQVLLLSWSLFSVQTGFATQLQLINNVQYESQLAKEKNLPILILFSIEHCPYCRLVKEDFLIPMLISGNYKEKVIIRELNIDNSPMITGLSGSQQSAASYAYSMGVSLYPTMVFINHQGCILSETIKGVNTPSMFGGRIDQAIDEANKKIKTAELKC
ncbi:MAG: thioredoxin family protein [Pseudomonadota bacterium]